MSCGAVDWACIGEWCTKAGRHFVSQAQNILELIRMLLYSSKVDFALLETIDISNKL